MDNFSTELFTNARGCVKTGLIVSPIELMHQKVATWSGQFLGTVSKLCGPGKKLYKADVFKIGRCVQD